MFGSGLIFFRLAHEGAAQRTNLIAYVIRPDFLVFHFGPAVSCLPLVAFCKTRLAAMETLAIIAYRQPILRANVEAIRGVQVGRDELLARRPRARRDPAP